MSEYKSYYEEYIERWFKELDEEGLDVTEKGYLVVDILKKAIDMGFVKAEHFAYELDFCDNEKPDPIDLEFDGAVNYPVSTSQGSDGVFFNLRTVNCDRYISNVSLQPYNWDGSDEDDAPQKIEEEL